MLHLNQLIVDQIYSLNYSITPDFIHSAFLGFYLYVCWGSYNVIMDGSEVLLLHTLEGRSSSFPHLGSSASCWSLEGEAAWCQLVTEIFITILCVLYIFCVHLFVLFYNLTVIFLLIDWYRRLSRALGLTWLFDGVGCEHVNVGSGLRAVVIELFGFGKSFVLILLASVHDTHNADGTDCNSNYHGNS